MESLGLAAECNPLGKDDSPGGGGVRRRAYPAREKVSSVVSHRAIGGHKRHTGMKPERMPSHCA